MRTDRRALARTAGFLAVLAVLTAGSAVGAAELVSGATIKDGTLTGADLADHTVGSADVREGSLLGRDIRDRSLGLSDLSETATERLRGPAHIRGFVVAHDAGLVAAGDEDNLSVSCPPGTVALSVQGYLGDGTDFTGRAGTQASMGTDGGTVFVRNTTASTQLLTIDVMCGAVDPSAARAAR